MIDMQGASTQLLLREAQADTRFELLEARISILQAQAACEAALALQLDVPRPETGAPPDERPGGAPVGCGGGGGGGGLALAAWRVFVHGAEASSESPFACSRPTRCLVRASGSLAETPRR
eukprot:CAMPEP_0183515188 /NCGR_PEP_ID=MMETSP0371-20130417/13363_1 /TAXON_ID=268820 /ORGANISM="Peridinium aciculiferum, Strain PAER-2" /LENGTH=119 /DNA_ID=CAMNT_0025712701 /DNA_START=110 /DNA_END=467 /DNA_ORIENTATION=+